MKILVDSLMTGEKVFNKIHFFVEVLLSESSRKVFDINTLLGQLKGHFGSLGARNVWIEDEFVLMSTEDESSALDLTDKNTELENSVKKCDYQLRGIIEICEPSLDQISSFISSICSPDNRYDLLFNFEQNLLFSIGGQLDEEASSLDSVSFTFGNIINGNRFVSHTNYFETSYGSKLSMPSEIKAEISRELRQMTLQFKLIHCHANETMKNAFDWGKFVFDFSSIYEIITCPRDEESVFYFKLLYPPKFYLKQGGDWIRKNESDFLQKDIIGKSKALKIGLNAKNLESCDNGLFTILPTVYSILRDNYFTYRFAGINEYCIDSNNDIFGRLLGFYGFPFEVKYALKCIDSFSHSFIDDLITNGQRDAVYSLIDSHDAQTVSKALYRLLQSYVRDEVFYAHEKFSQLIITVMRESKGDQNNFEGHQMKRIVITPSRTIYLPPASTSTRFVMDIVDPSHMVMVYIRDDDAPYTPESLPIVEQIPGSELTQFMKDSKRVNQFLTETVRKRLFEVANRVTSSLFSKSLATISISTQQGSFNLPSKLMPNHGIRSSGFNPRPINRLYDYPDGPFGQYGYFHDVPHRNGFDWIDDPLIAQGYYDPATYYLPGRRSMRRNASTDSDQSASTTTSSTCSMFQNKMFESTVLILGLPSNDEMN